MKDEKYIILDKITLDRTNQPMKFDMEISANSLTMIMGPNGAGKSTLLNLIAGFETPDSGRLIVNGVDLTNTEPSERPISMIFQENNLFPHLTVRKNVELGLSPSLKLSKTDDSIITAALERTKLLKKEKYLPNKLSGGERQRVAIARCLVRNQPILLLDEPFTSIDHSLINEMRILIKELQQEKNMMILLVSHNMEDAETIGDRIVFLKNGKVDKNINLCEPIHTPPENRKNEYF